MVYVFAILLVYRCAYLWIYVQNCDIMIYHLILLYTIVWLILFITAFTLFFVCYMCLVWPWWCQLVVLLTFISKHYLCLISILISDDVQKQALSTWLNGHRVLYYISFCAYAKMVKFTNMSQLRIVQQIL